MTEPKEIADQLDDVIDGVHHWQIHNSCIGGGISSSQALVAPGECVLIDPVRLDEALLATLPAPTAIAITSHGHQRAAWRYRRDFGAQVWLPADSEDADEEPDRRYAEGDVLPGGLLAVRTPGPEWSHFCFLLEAGPGVLFCSDLLMRDDDGRLGFTPFEFHEDPAATRSSVEYLLGLRFSVLCLTHGAPLVDGPKTAMRKLLAEG